MADLVQDGPLVRITTDRYEAVVATEGYTSGVQGGSFHHLASGARDLGHGLLIADFLLEPGSDELPAEDPLHYHRNDPYHGTLAKRYVELPQICTQAKRLPCQLFRGHDFVAVRQWFRWHTARPPYRPGSLWEQWLVFPDGVDWFLGYDRITSVNDCPAMVFRGDVPGHIKHQAGDGFEQIYLSYEGYLPAGEFGDDFPPDAKHLYQRDDSRIPPRMIRAYQTAAGPWLAALTLDAAAVHEAWCHQRGYVCMILEIGGRPVRVGDRFGAVHLVGWFDDVGTMEAVYDTYAGVKELEVTASGWTLSGG